MGKITLFHGTPDKIVVPTYGLGEKRHDYGIFKKKMCWRGLQN